MESEFLVLLVFLVIVWIPVTFVFLSRRHPVDVKVSQKRASRPNRRYRRYFKPAERKMRDQACRLISEIGEALKHNQRIQSERKTRLKAQVDQTADYVLVSLGKVARIRKHKSVLNTSRQAEITTLENRLLDEVARSLDVLEDALVSLTILDVARGDATIDRLLNNLEESNARLRDIADAHQEVRNAGKTAFFEQGVSRQDQSQRLWE
jgi:hypothetical protein